MTTSSAKTSIARLLAVLTLSAVACVRSTPAVTVVTPPAVPAPIVDTTPPPPDYFLVDWRRAQFDISATIVTREPGVTTPVDSVATTATIDLVPAETVVELHTADSGRTILRLNIDSIHPEASTVTDVRTSSIPCSPDSTPLNSPLLLRLLLAPNEVRGTVHDTLHYSHCINGAAYTRTAFYTWRARDSVIDVVVESAFDIDSSRAVPTTARGTLLGSGVLQRNPNTHAVDSLRFAIRTQLRGPTIRNGIRIMQSIDQEIRGRATSRNR